MPYNVKTIKRHCRDCGAPFEQDAARKAKFFCTDDCRFAHARRKSVRGSDAYDLLMAIRHQRDEASAANLWSLLCRLATEWKEEDARERNGRPSWETNVRELVQKHVASTATVVNKNAAGNKRRAA